MSKNEDRKRIAVSICSAAQLYKKNLVGKKFLFIFDNRCIEVIFNKSSFKHLTGVESNISADQFYKNAVKNILRKEQIKFSPQHPYNLCIRKLKHLPNIFTLPFSDCFLLEDIQTQTELYKFGATDTNYTLCMTLGKNGKDYVIQSLRDEDCFGKTANVYTVDSILSKRNDEKFYNVITFLDENYSLDSCSEEIKKKIDSSLF